MFIPADQVCLASCCWRRDIKGRLLLAAGDRDGLNQLKIFINLMNLHIFWWVGWPSQCVYTVYLFLVGGNFFHSSHNLKDTTLRILNNPDPLKNRNFEGPDPCYTGSILSPWRVQWFLKKWVPGRMMSLWWFEQIVTNVLIKVNFPFDSILDVKRVQSQWVFFSHLWCWGGRMGKAGSPPRVQLPRVKI